MADIHGSPGAAQQMPAATGPGPAPAPYTGPGLRPEPPLYGLPEGPYGPDGAFAEVMEFVGAATLGTTQSPVAHDVNAGPPDAPYYQGPHVAINAAGDSDAGGRDDVAASVAEAVSNAKDRFLEYQSDTYGQGSVIGDLMTLPPNPLDPGVGSLGTTDPSGSFYDPPRDYGEAI